MSGQPTYPDFGVTPGQLPGVSPDIAELAARSGYLSLRRTGKVICHDPCELLGPWLPFLGLGGLRVSAESQYAGDGCFEFSPAANYVELRRQFPPLENRTMGIEFFCRGDGISGNTLRIDVLQDYDIGLVAKIQVDFYNQVLQIWNPSTGSYQTVMAIGEAGYWHNIKLVINWSTQKITRVWIDDTSLQVGMPLASGGGVTGMYGILVKVHARNLSSYSRIWLDEIALTVDESDV